MYIYIYIYIHIYTYIYIYIYICVYIYLKSQRNIMIKEVGKFGSCYFYPHAVGSIEPFAKLLLGNGK